jgi:cytochrome c oxidase assembly factor CtaG
MPLVLLAHAGAPLAPHDLWTAWGAEPGSWAVLLAGGWLYARGAARLWRRAGPGRGVRRWEAGSFAAGWAALVLALASPLHPLGEALFSAHMVQHELLMVVAAPLLVLGRPVVPLLWALPVPGRRALGGWAKGPAVRGAWGAVSGPTGAWLLHGAALWIWHVPALYALSVRSGAAHAAQHAAFLGTALVFWWAVLPVWRRRTGHGAAVFALFATVVHSGALGALLTVAPRPLYPVSDAAAAAWGLTPLEDQQLAGLVMWVPAGLAYAVAGLVLAVGWLRESERRAARWQRRALSVT